jgi:hypothetical protein
MTFFIKLATTAIKKSPLVVGFGDCVAMAGDGVSSRTDVRDLRFLPAVEMTEGSTEMMLSILPHSLLLKWRTVNENLPLWKKRGQGRFGQA